MFGYSPGNSEVYTVLEKTDEHFFGIAYDSLTDTLYWSGNYINSTWTISRANRNGTGLERAVPKSNCTLVLFLCIHRAMASRPVASSLIDVLNI